jgi:hypothetical protein
VSTKPQDSSASSRSPSAARRTTGASSLGKIADFYSIAVARLSETLKRRMMASRLAVML